jgi:hypothetical protein
VGLPVELLPAVALPLFASDTVAMRFVLDTLIDRVEFIYGV